MSQKIVTHKNRVLGPVSDQYFSTSWILKSRLSPQAIETEINVWFPFTLNGYYKHYRNVWLRKINSQK